MYQPQPQYGGGFPPQQQRKGCWGRNWKWIVPTGCLGLILLVVAAAAGIFFFVVSTVKSSEVYRQALEKAKNDPAVIAELGQPINDGWFVVGSIETKRSFSGARFNFPISGPKKSGTVYVVALKTRELNSDDEWHFETLEVEVNGRPDRIDLLEHVRPTPSPDEDGDTGLGNSNTDTSLPASPPPPSSNRPSVSGGVLDARAISKPAPAYPPAARAAKASGTVNVQVTVDEEGNVISATAVSGHPLLGQAAVAAARQAKFAPFKLGGKPVKVTGVLTYNFVPE